MSITPSGRGRRLREKLLLVLRPFLSHFGSSPSGFEPSVVSIIIRMTPAANAPPAESPLKQMLNSFSPEKPIHLPLLETIALYTS